MYKPITLKTFATAAKLLFLRNAAVVFEEDIKSREREKKVA